MLDGRGAKPCRCRTLKERAAALALIPPYFGEPRLDTLAPRPDLHPAQAKEIAHIRKNPNASYMLVGRNGVGKSHLAWSLYAHAVEQGRRCVAVKMDALLSQYRRFELMRTDDPENMWRPDVLSEDLKQTARRWCIFIDELEKATPTEFAAKRFFYLVDAIREYGHQLITTSNLQPQTLQAHWSRDPVNRQGQALNGVWGNSIAARIAEVCTKVDLF